MSNQMLIADLLEDISLDQQQSLAGGQMFEDEELDADTNDGGETTGSDTSRTRRFKIRSVGIISIRKLSS